jgi:cysteinyl-tRNA synthetase
MACSSLSVTAGQIGDGQTASNLATAQLTGTTDTWDDYVELSPASQIVCNYLLPSGITSSAVSSLALQVNYRGPSKNTMTWTFEVQDATTGAWVLLGDNAFATGWVWTPTTFTLPGPLARFFSSGTLKIRYGTASSADASDVDQLLMTGTH